MVLEISVLVIGAVMFFFVSSRRRHTRCALVTGVQTCALPICHARHLGPFQRFPYLSGDPSLADAAGLDRLPGRIPLQAALPASLPAAAEADRKSTRLNPSH